MTESCHRDGPNGSFDLVFGAEPLLGRRTGIGNYAWHLYRGMQASHIVRRIHPFANLRWMDPATLLNGSKQHPQGVDRPRWRRALASLPGYVSLRTAAQSSRFRRSLSRLAGPLVYHEPNYVLRPFDGPSVATVHDLGWIHYPDFVAPVTRRWLEKGMPYTLERATRIVTVSEHVAHELTEIFDVPAARIRVTPLGVDKRRFHPRPAADLKSGLSPLGLDPSGYVLSVATLEPRKNLTGLIRAFSRLPQRLQRRYPLVLVGTSGWGPSLLTKELERLENKGVVRRLGYVDDASLPLLYAGAAALAAPAFYEGFGLPVIEAMASGTPVLTSNRSAMAEVADDAASLVDPADDKAISAGLEHLLTDPHFSRSLVAKGLERSGAFTWERTVERTADIYLEVLRTP